MMSRLNLITDLSGISVGNADDAGLASGVTAIRLETPNVFSGVVRGGAPGGRDTALMDPEMTVESANAVMLGGGSAFGLDATGGVMAVLREQGIGFAVGAVTVPIVVGAITFDLLNGGNKTWGRMPPYWELGYKAAAAARPGPFALGSVGGGYGATTSTLKGGLGSASCVTSFGYTVGAIVVVNAVGQANIGNGPHFWSGGVEEGAEFGGLGLPTHVSLEARAMRIKGAGPPSTTIALVATDAILTKGQAKRLAIMADDGLARAIRPAHAPMDGDTVFAVSTMQKPLAGGPIDLTEIGLAAADCLARAIARGIYEATALPFPGALPSWRDKFGAKG